MVGRELNIQIEQRFDKNTLCVWVTCDEGPNGMININYSDGSIVRESVSYSDVLTPGKVKPFIELQRPFAMQLFKVLAEYLSNNGYKTKDENLIEGKLIATEKHLDDMRVLSERLINLIDRSLALKVKK